MKLCASGVVEVFSFWRLNRGWELSESAADKFDSRLDVGVARRRCSQVGFATVHFVIRYTFKN